MTVQPGFPAFASPEALLIIICLSKKSTGVFALGAVGMLMGERNYGNFTPARTAERGAGREKTPGFSLRCLRQSRVGQSRTRVFKCLLRSDTDSGARERQPKVEASQSLPSVSFLSLSHTSAKQSHFQYVVHTGSLSDIIQRTELRNILLDYSILYSAI